MAIIELTNVRSDAMQLLVWSGLRFMIGKMKTFLILFFHDHEQGLQYIPKTALLVLTDDSNKFIFLNAYVKRNRSKHTMLVEEIINNKLH